MHMLRKFHRTERDFLYGNRDYLVVIRMVDFAAVAPFMVQT